MAGSVGPPLILQSLPTCSAHRYGCCRLILPVKEEEMSPALAEHTCNVSVAPRGPGAEVLLLVSLWHPEALSPKKPGLCSHSNVRDTSCALGSACPSQGGPERQPWCSDCPPFPPACLRPCPHCGPSLTPHCRGQARPGPVPTGLTFWGQTVAKPPGGTV